MSVTLEHEGEASMGENMAQPADLRRYRAANENGDLAEEIQGRRGEVGNPVAPVSIPEAVANAGLNVSTPKELDVHRALELRANRADFFGKGLFGEPAWDMLLKLYAADFSGRAESISNACLASGVPPSTALRWLRVLQSEGWIERPFDPAGRQFLIALSTKSRVAMERLFGHSPDQIPEFRWHLRIGRGL